MFFFIIIKGCNKAHPSIGYAIFHTRGNQAFIGFHPIPDCLSLYNTICMIACKYTCRYYLILILFSIISGFIASAMAVSLEIIPSLYNFKMLVSIATICSEAEV